MRKDLEVSRHLFRGESAYVVRDPLTFQSFRLNLTEYRIFTAIDRDRALGEIFDSLVRNSGLTVEDEDAFYSTVFILHRHNCLSLPVTNDKMLYQRYTAKKRARMLGKIFGFFFLRIPVFNPDFFLSKTIDYVRFLFNRWFVTVWGVLLVFGLAAAIVRWSELFRPLSQTLVAGNIPLMWGLLIGLKVIHEFGHAYACRHYGGHVPEMGIYLVILTPLAYMDATASWGFSSKWRRVIVCLAGMYFESLVALPAMAVWCLTEPGLVNELAYCVVFLAGVSTVIFNINPLMRYDGYYVLADLLEYPNFRQMSVKYVLHVLKRIFLGVRDDMSVGNLKTKGLLFGYGVAVSLYRVGIYLAISAILASKMFLTGLTLGVTFVAVTLFSTLRKMMNYLSYSPETATIRRRAVAMGIGLLVLTPVLILVVPIRSTVRPMGVLETQSDVIVRAKVDGFVDQIPGEVYRQVKPEDPLVVMKNEVYAENLARAEAKIQIVQIRGDAFAIMDPTKAVQEKSRAAAYELERNQNREDLENLTVRAGKAGRVISLLSPRDLGRYVQQGCPVATISSGAWTVRALLTQEQMADTNPVPGDVVEIKVPTRPFRTFTGVITRLVPGGNRKIDEPALTKPGGGEIICDPVTRKTDQPYYEMQVVLDPAEDFSILYSGLTCQVNCRPGSDTLGVFLYRRMARFLNRTLQR